MSTREGSLALVASINGTLSNNDFGRAVAGDPNHLPSNALARYTASDPNFAESFSRFLADQKVCERSVLDRAQRAAHTTGERFDHVLTKLGLVSEFDLAAAVANYLSMPLVLPAQIPAVPVLAEIIDAAFVQRAKIMPLAADDQQITVGMTDPFNDEPIRALAFLMNRPVLASLFRPADFEKAFASVYLASTDPTSVTAEGDGAEASELDVQRLRDIASEAPIIRLVNQIVTHAVETRASDIHIEPTADVVLVRERVDGVLRTADTLAAGIRAAVTSRIKIMAKLDIAERRMPQDGRIKIAIRGVDIDFRVSTIPTAFGESIVMRILDRSRVELDFIKLGFDATNIATFERLLVIAHPLRRCDSAV